MLHLEKSVDYGGPQEASIRASVNDVRAMVVNELGGVARDAEDLEESGPGPDSGRGWGWGRERERTYLDINPFVISPCGRLADTLLEYGLAPLLDFFPIERMGVIVEGRPVLVPRSKEEVMLDTLLSLLEKRQLMKLVRLHQTQISDDHTPLVDHCQRLGIERDSRIFAMLVYGICGARDTDEAERLTVADMASASRTHFDGLERLNGAAAWLYPVGGSNLIIQALCRAAAVKGTIHLLGQSSLALYPVAEGDERGCWRVSGCFDGEAWQVSTDQVIVDRTIVDQVVADQTIANRIIADETRKSPRFTRTILVLREGAGRFGGERGRCSLWTIAPQGPTRSYSTFVLQVPANGHTIVYGWAHHEQAPLVEFEAHLKATLALDPSDLLLSASYHNQPTHPCDSPCQRDDNPVPRR